MTAPPRFNLVVSGSAWLTYAGQLRREEHRLLLPQQTSCPSSAWQQLLPHMNVQPTGVAHWSLASQYSPSSQQPWANGQQALSGGQHWDPQM